MNYKSIFGCLMSTLKWLLKKAEVASPHRAAACPQQCYCYMSKHFKKNNEEVKFIGRKQKGGCNHCIHPGCENTNLKFWQQVKNKKKHTFVGLGFFFYNSIVGQIHRTNLYKNTTYCISFI